MGGIAGLIGAFLYETAALRQMGLWEFLFPSCARFMCCFRRSDLQCSDNYLTCQSERNRSGSYAFGVGFGNFFGGSLSKLAGGVGQISVAVTGAAFKKQIPVLSGPWCSGTVIIFLWIFNLSGHYSGSGAGIFPFKDQKGLNLRAVGEARLQQMRRVLMLLYTNIWQPASEAVSAALAVCTL